MTESKELRIQLRDNQSIPESPWPSSAIESVNAAIHTACEGIRLYYYSRLPILREIPYAALEVNGRDGWSKDYYYMYQECLYSLVRESEFPKIYMELRTGMIIYFPVTPTKIMTTPEKIFVTGGEREAHLVDDEEVYRLFTQDYPDIFFDPAEALHDLRTRSFKPYLHENKPELHREELFEKEKDRLALDRLMAALPIESVLANLRSQGYPV